MTQSDIAREVGFAIFRNMRVPECSVVHLTFSLKTVPIKNRESRAIMRRWKDIIAMKRSKFTESQIVFALKQAETGVAVAEVCRKLGVSEATFYNWKKKYGGLGPDELRRLRQLEEENTRLKQIVADLSLDKQMLQDVLKKKL